MRGFFEQARCGSCCAGEPGEADVGEELVAVDCTSRETATKVLGEFADCGLIRLGRGRITVLDCDQIGTEAGG